jgi:anti-sigma B factor antagonist
MTDLDITAHTTDGVLRLAVCGEVDMANSDDLAAVTHEAATGGALRAIVVDLGRVSFMDSNGIRVLVLEQGYARERGIAFRITNPSHRVRRVLEVTGVLPMLTDEAHSAGGSPCPAR